MDIKKHIPNFITLLNLFCGSIAVIFAVNNSLILAAFFVFLGIFFDFFDGFFARKLNVSSEIGLQLDSLADMVTSGLVPGIVLFKLISLSIDAPAFADTNTDWNDMFQFSGFKASVLPLIGLFVTCASAYRLAKFNIDVEQQDFFKGLPTPANTLLIMSLPLIIEFQNNDLINSIILNQWFLIGLIVFSCYILTSNIKLFALKFKDYSFKNNIIRYVFLILCVVLLIVLHFAAIPLIILLYILLSIISK
ncbi:CDP-alcohol phosphatidyltransferase family protein [Aurantibacter sp.]|uniref:CDP-alcohol phosphatidyltransferase family protein n=1 Tax=Aurantibacter sp. TaxID=2807103 RepID=UPI0035C83325